MKTFDHDRGLGWARFELYTLKFLLELEDYKILIENFMDVFEIESWWLLSFELNLGVFEI